MSSGSKLGSNKAVAFFKKKLRKKFFLIPLEAWLAGRPKPRINKSFFAAFFSKTEALTSFQHNQIAPLI
jgi:hypothetical protein